MAKKKTSKTPSAPAVGRAAHGSPTKVPLVRRLTQKQADRIRKLVDCCGVMTSDGKIELYPGSHNFGGDPIKDLTWELSMLLQGHEPSSHCKDVV